MPDISSDSTNPTPGAASRRVTALLARLKDSALDVLWKQWSALDAHAAVREPARSIVDTEALVLLSLGLIDEEKRLTDLLHDWVIRNSDLVSIQRIRNLARAYAEPVGERLGWLASVAVMEGKDPRWRSIPRQTEQPDPSLQKTVRKGKTRANRARFETPAALWIRLRSGLGVGAKTDTLVFLLGREGESASVREIALATKYTVAAVRRAAEDMAAARLIRSQGGGAVVYSADQVAWSRLLGMGSKLPRWRNWAQKFEFIAAFRSWACVLPTENTSYAVDVAVRELVSRHHMAFLDDGTAVGNRYLMAFEKTTVAWDAVEALAVKMREEA